MRRLTKAYFLFFISAATLIASCNGGEQTASEPKKNSDKSFEQAEEYDPKRGLGKFEDIELGSIDRDLAERGHAIYESKCRACHKLSDELLVGPGWAGVSEKHRPEWLLNFITDPDPMLNVDPELQAQLELCLVRMPNQFLTDDEAYALVEFMRVNDE